MAVLEASRGSEEAAPLAAAGIAAAAMAAAVDVGAGLIAGAVVLLAGAAVIDFRTRRLPNAINYAGFAACMLGALLLEGGRPGSALAGAGLGFGFFLLMSILSRGAVGMGDAKLAAFGGALVGSRYLLPALLLGSLSAVPVVGFLLLTHRIGRKDPICYGPYLAAGFAFVAVALGTSF